MELKLNKKKLKNLSNDNAALPAEMTPQVAGGTGPFVEITGTKCMDQPTTNQSFVCQTFNCA
jgi:hypothetical protein